MKHWVKRTLARRISGHVQAWEQAKGGQRARLTETRPFVTVSSEFGCSGAELGNRLAQALNERRRSDLPWVPYGRELLDIVASEMQLRPEIIETLNDGRRDEMSELFDIIIHRRVEDAIVFRKISEVARSLALRGHVVLIGRGCHLITHDLDGGLHVRLSAPSSWRIARYAMEHDMSHRQAEKRLSEAERRRVKFFRTFFDYDAARRFHHHLTVDNSRFNIEQLTRIVLSALDACFGES